jgi:hypothetical protein
LADPDRLSSPSIANDDTGKACSSSLNRFLLAGFLFTSVIGRGQQKQRQSRFLARFEHFGKMMSAG